jgi:hypothetical protein
MLNLLDMGGSYRRPPPFYQRPNSQKSKCQKSEKISIPPLISLLCTLFFNFYQNHLVCLHNTFEKTYPESRSPKDSCIMHLKIPIQKVGVQKAAAMAAAL